MEAYGSWRESLEIDGVRYRADLIERQYADGAGFSSIYAIDGLPPRFETAALTAAQVCEVPHTWRVQECKGIADVTQELLQQAKQKLDADRASYNACVVCYVGARGDSAAELVFVAASAVRNKLTRDYLNDRFPVISRAIVHPEYRGKRLGSMLVEHQAKILLRGYFGCVPSGIHFGTESERFLSSARNVEREEKIKFVYIGDEQYETADGVHTVHDFLCFLETYQASLSAACDAILMGSADPQPVVQFKRQLRQFMASGIEQVSGDALEDLFRQIIPALDEQESTRAAQEQLEELFVVKSKIGATDPKR